MAHKTKAERSFEEKTGAAVREKDWPAVEKTFYQFGTYLELTGLDEPVGEARTFEFPSRAQAEPEPEPEPAKKPQPPKQRPGS